MTSIRRLLEVVVMSCEAVEAGSRGRRDEAERHAGHRCKHDLKEKNQKHAIIKETIIVE